MLLQAQPEMRLVWAVICESSSTDAETNRISLFNLLEELTFAIIDEPGTPERPLLPVPVQIVSLWERSDYGVAEAPQTTRLRIVDQADGHEIIVGPEVQIVLDPFLRSRAAVRLQAIPLRASHLEAGAYLYDFELQSLDGEAWTTQGRVPLRLVVQEPAGVDTSIAPQAESE
jgi:hypothetical protein